MKFTYDYYRTFIETLKKHYQFISFNQAKYSKEKLVKKVLLRHDIDQSLEKAAIMADIEFKCGVSSTYFIYFRSPFYNIFSNNDIKYIESIIEKNHNIGLHFDYPNNENISISKVIYQIKKEADFIQNFFSISLDSISFHRPFSMEFFNNLELSSYPHTYEKFFVNDFKYYSDSRGRWRYGNPLESDAFKKLVNLQILIHPIWWNYSELSPEESIKKFKAHYLKNFKLNIYNELKSFWEEKK